jgi:hypothetical protein
VKSVRRARKETRTLKRLSLTNKYLTPCSEILPNDDWAFLERMKNLQGLSLSRSPGFNDATLGYIKRLPKLRFLELTDIKITPQGIETLIEMNLRHLALARHLDLTAETIHGLKDLATLRSLDLSYVALSYGRFQALAGLKIRHLALVNNHLTDDALLKFDHFPNLQDLILNSQKIN